MLTSVRARLTMWYVAALGVVLLMFSLSAYWLLARSLYDRLDARLVSTLQATTLNGAKENPRFPNQTAAILDSSGSVIAQTTSRGGLPLRLPTAPLNSSDTPIFYELSESRPDADDSVRGVILATPDSHILDVMESVEPLENELDVVSTALIITVPLTLVLAGCGARWLIRRSLDPVVAMSERAQQMSVENLDKRLEISNPHDEFGHLAATFNALLDRISGSFARQREFVADASHELRTPLSVIRTTSSVALQRKDRDSSEYHEALAIVEEEARRLSRIVEDMLTLARADAGHPYVQRADFYLNELLADVARAAGVLASRKNIQIEVSALPEAPCNADEALLRQMLMNLLDNSIRHTPAGGKVQVVLEPRGEQYSIKVTDTGSGIPTKDHGHIFERFYRADKARSRSETVGGSGAGLGLPIARSIAEAHHGRLELERSDETGSTFVVTVPR